MTVKSGMKRRAVAAVVHTEGDMPTYRMLVEYNGAAFYGWQVQPGLRTVQGEIENAIGTVLRRAVRVIGSGRTDTGVHARGQVAHFELPESIEPYRLRHALNGVLGGDIAILSVACEDESFHARYDASERTYHYYVTTLPRTLDRHMRVHLRPAPHFGLMNDAAQHLVGRHDYSAFCRTESSTKNRLCMIATARWEEEQRTGDYRFVIGADRFLHGMVRAIVGTLLEIGRGKRPADDIPRILESRDRREAGPAAPAKGLVLVEVRYRNRSLDWELKSD